LLNKQNVSDLTTAAKPRAIADYDYDKKLGSQYEEDYPDYSGDFSKVGNEPAAAQQAPVTKVQLLDDSGGKKTTSVTSQRTTPTELSSSTAATTRAADLELTKLTASTQRTSAGSSTTRCRFFESLYRPKSFRTNFSPSFGHKFTAKIQT
jgi:hypothetical protein